MVNEKKGTMLSLDVDIVDRAKALGINMSNVTNITLKYLVDGSSLQPIRTDLLLLQQDIARTRNELSLRSLEAQGLAARLEDLLTMEQNLAGMLRAADRDTELARSLEKLRSLIVTNIPLIEIIENKELIDRIEDLLMMEITLEWLGDFQSRVIKE